MEIVNQIFELVLIPLLAALTGFAVKWIRAKTEALKTQTQDAMVQKYLDRLDDTITHCIIATNQTYVNVLKNRGEFTPEAQKEAFQKTYDNVMAIMTDEMRNNLNEALGDLNSYIVSHIEAEVLIQKDV